MKKIILLGLSLALLLISCKEGKPQMNNKHISIIIDPTDSLKVRPNFQELIQFFCLSDKWHGNSYQITIINESHVTKTYSSQIKSSTSYKDSDIDRNNELRAFLKDFEEHLSMTEYNVEKPYSSIIEVLSNEMANINMLPKNTDKQILVWSDLRENSDIIRFYSKKQLQLLRTQPESVLKILEKKVPIEQVDDVRLQFIYDSDNPNEALIFQNIASVYTKMFTKAGCIVITSKNLQVSNCQ